MKRVLLLSGLLGAGIFTFLAACNLKIAPTYDSKRIASDLKQMVARDYHVGIETRHRDENLQASFMQVGLLKPGQLEMQESAAKALQGVMLCATRVSLSTDARLKFIGVKMMDALTGASVTLWRFVPDIRDSMYTRLAEDEYFNRLVMEFNVAEDEKDKDWKELTWDPPMTMAAFLAKQVVLRVKRQSPIGLEVHEDLSRPATLIVVMDNWSAVQEQGLTQEEKVSDLVEKTAKMVVKGYRFTGFHEFVLKDSRGFALRRWAL